MNAADFGKVGVLFGGRSTERDISLMTGQGVLAALRRRGVDAHAFDTGERSLAELAQQEYARVFIALHGPWGEDGTIQGALELLGIPYTGSGVMASAVAMDKIFTKRIWTSFGLPTPGFRVLAHEADLQGMPEELGLPVMIKPAHGGSTIGMSRVDRAEDLLAAWHLAAQLDADVLAERFVSGRELTVAVLQDVAQAGVAPRTRALPVIEIVAPDGNYDYRNKYFTDDTRYLCPAPLNDAAAQAIQALAVRAFEAVGCAGWGRVDIMLDDSGKAWLLEVNTSPGMTGHSLVPMAANAVDMNYEELCLTILSGASLKNRAAPRAAAAALLQAGST